jgi:hypothetical protein
VTGRDVLRRLRGLGCGGDPAEGVARPSSVRSVSDDGSSSSRSRPATGDATGHRTRLGAVPGTEVVAVNRYRVVLERDERGMDRQHPPFPGATRTDGAWSRRDGACGGTALWIDGADGADLVDDVRLPGEVADAVRRSRGARRVGGGARCGRDRHEPRRSLGLSTNWGSAFETRPISSAYRTNASSNSFARRRCGW